MWNDGDAIDKSKYAVEQVNASSIAGEHELKEGSGSRGPSAELDKQGAKQK